MATYVERTLVIDVDPFEVRVYVPRDRDQLLEVQVNRGGRSILIQGTKGDVVREAGLLRDALNELISEQHRLER
jgi:hypothetical protein